MTPTSRDLAALWHWWRELQPDIAPTTRGLWFGITELASGGSLRALYVAGCPTFDADDEDGEWATDYCWWPEDRYLTLSDFAMLPDRPYSEVLAYGVNLVRTLGVLALPGIEGAAVGFDGGDLVVL